MLSRQLYTALGRSAGSRLISSARLLATNPALRTSTTTSTLIRNAQALSATPMMGKTQQRTSTTVSGPIGHGNLFRIEKLFPLAMLPLFPAAYFVHGGVIDYALALAISLHAHWGIHIVIEDYGRPILLGPALAKIVHNLAYLISIGLLVGLLSFNYNDVGISTGLQMIWSL